MEVREWVPPSRPKMEEVRALLKRGWKVSHGLLWHPTNNEPIYDPGGIEKAVLGQREGYYVAMCSFRMVRLNGKYEGT